MSKFLTLEGNVYLSSFHRDRMEVTRSASVCMTGRSNKTKEIGEWNLFIGNREFCWFVVPGLIYARECHRIQAKSKCHEFDLDYGVKFVIERVGCTDAEVIFVG